MCIMWFVAHNDGPRVHDIGSWHCAHLDCPGTLEYHHKCVLVEPRADCAECLKADGDQVDQEVCAYPAIPHCELAYVEGTGWVKGAEEENVAAGGQNQEEDDDEVGSYHSFRSLSDVDSITSHWRLDPPRRARRNATAPQDNSPAPAPHASPAVAEPYETRSAHDPHEMQEVGSPYHENGSNQDPNIPDVAEGQFADSPNTLKHRHLVNGQLKELKKLTKRMSRHRRQNSGPGRPQQHHRRQNSQATGNYLKAYQEVMFLGTWQCLNPARRRRGSGDHFRLLI
ncbi:uncharacterized protein J4E78_002616 [Alternaria triticimaculans]|uniref:uncharacterized protein n=1 Tax=Alternaria triticimaculans TaxID=297637 RepID=UPI0020C2F67A|nr:uncharacterized protein J4E78_002616 [Alternaria triticimaculans]KAI4668788.1 hypothetical protein J4E78_002616 [Alternaria triticimaculans]